MDERLKKLLAVAIEDVIQTGNPVGSQHLVEEYDLEMSSATVRNWFAELEEQGFLGQTHTSSGRLPTEKGYRLYVEELMHKRPLNKREVQDLEKAIDTADSDDQKNKAAAKFAAEAMGNAVVLGLHTANTYYTGLSQLFAQPEFSDWRRVVNFSGILDQLDDMLQAIRQKTFRDPTIMIGGECPFGSICGSVMLTLDDGTFMGFLGPMRMDYAKACSLMLAIKQKLK